MQDNKKNKIKTNTTIKARLFDEVAIAIKKQNKKQFLKLLTFKNLKQQNKDIIIRLIKIKSFGL